MPRYGPLYVVATAGDDYKSLAELANLAQGAGRVPRLVEGFLSCQSQGVTWLYSRGNRPATTAEGLPMAVDDKAGVGPTGPDSAWDLSDIWVRNTTAGQNGKLIATGVAYYP